MAGNTGEAALPVADPADSERAQAAIAVRSRADMARLDDGIALATADRRDVLTHAGPGDDGWPSRLDTELGPAATS